MLQHSKSCARCPVVLCSVLMSWVNPPLLGCCLGWLQITIWSPGPSSLQLQTGSHSTGGSTYGAQGQHTSRDKQAVNKSNNVHQSLGTGHHWAGEAWHCWLSCVRELPRLQTNAWLAEFRIFSTMRLVRKATISHYQLPVSHPTNYLGLQPIKRRQASHQAAGYMITPYYAFNFQYLQFWTTIKQISVQY